MNMALQMKQPPKIERGKSYDIIEKIREQKFTGLVKLSFKTDEISKSELFVENGIPIAMETRKIRTGRFLRGNEAFHDFISAENCVAELYVSETDAFSIFSADSRLELGKIFGVKEEEITDKVSESEGIIEVERKKVSEVDKAKLEMAKLLDIELGKIARKYVKLLESVKSHEELFETKNQIFGFLESLTAFLSKEKVSKLKKELDRIYYSFKELEDTRIESEEIDEFENFKKNLVAKVERILGSGELREIIERLEDWEDLVQKYPQIKKTASKFATIVPWNKIEELLRTIEESVAEEIGIKLE